MDSGSIFFNNSSNFDGNMLFLGNSDHVYHPGGRSMICMEETTKRSRPFFSSPEEMFDEDYYDEQMPEKKRRLTAEQVHMLEKSFETENKLEPERKTHLAKKLGLQPRQVAVWFQNRRARWKNRQLEKDYDVLKSSYDSLLSDYDSMVKEHEKLKSEVVSLTDKLQAKEAGGRDPMLGHISDNTSPPNTAEAQVSVKVEDRLSTGTGASAVVDDDGPQLVDSGNSYFFQTDNDYPEYVGPIDHHVVQSEEEDGSDDGQNYFSDVFALTEDQNHDEGEPLGWWDWS